MRTTRNPMTAAQAKQRGRLVLCVITHLPNDWQQYHVDRWPVVALSLRSLKAHANVPFHLAIYDNGSHPEFRAWLQDEIQPDTLILSANVGKSVARKALFGMFPPDTVMGMADDDMYYYPDWVMPQLEILDHFPNVGTVTGHPVRTMGRWANDNTRAWAREHATLEAGRFVTEEWDYEYCLGIGREYDFHLQHSADVVDYRITYKGKQALSLGHHAQFICWNERIAPLLRWDADAMADEKPFDRAVDENYLRLCTTERLVRHMGNVLDDSLIALARKHKLSVTVPCEGGVTGQAGRAAHAVEASPALPSITAL